MFNNSMPSLSDIAAVTNNNDGFGGNNGWWVLILLFAICGGWGGNWNGGFGGSGSGAADNYVLASDFATLQRQVDSARTTIESKLDGVNNGICSLGYDQLGQMNGINKNITDAQFNVLTQLNTMAAQQQACCCATDNLINNGFSTLNYNLAKEACDTRRAIIDNDNANFRALDARITAMEMSRKDEKIAELTTKLNSYENRCAIVNDLRPAPIPAYQVANPYAGCGCNTCC